jgi:hypothetical protein
MTKNPYLNALAAGAYIVLVALVMQYGLMPAEPSHVLVIPIIMLSLFTLSAAVMGFLFLSQPIQLYLDGKKKEALTFFLQTVLAFGSLTVLAILLVVSGIVS